MKLYDLSNPRIDLDDLLASGVPQDGIPPLTNPKREKAMEADYPAPESRVVVVALGKEAVAYPLGILNYHEIVNDTVGGVPLAILYCPLCDSVSVIDRRLPGSGEEGDKNPVLLEFGVSGFLYNSNLVRYDRTFRSLWPQVLMKAVTGPPAGRSLRHLPVRMSLFEDFRKAFPEGEVILETPKGRIVVSANAAGFVVASSPPGARTVQTFYHSWSASYPKTRIIQ